MADVIFNGSAARKSLGLAEVTIVFDNARGVLATAAEEVQITRRVYRDGEGEYLINGQPSRLKDIKDLFLGSGAGAGRLLHHRAGPGRCAAAGLDRGPPDDLRGGGRHQPLQGQEGRNAAQAGARRSEPDPAAGHPRRGRKAAPQRQAAGGQGPALPGIHRPAARPAAGAGPARVPPTRRATGRGRKRCSDELAGRARGRRDPVRRLDGRRAAIGSRTGRPGSDGEGGRGSGRPGAAPRSPPTKRRLPTSAARPAGWRPMSPTPAAGSPTPRTASPR